MFTGLVQSLPTVCEVEDRPPGKRIVVRSDVLAHQVAVGDSVAINGCCLTVVLCQDGRMGFDAGSETLRRTNLGQLVAGDKVNLELSLRVGDRLGGHFVTGHVEGTGTLVKREDDRDWSIFWFGAPSELDRYMASKGSIAVDGVSLTLVDVEPERFSVALIPHTLDNTTLGALRVGDRVNLETDLLAKYAQKQPVSFE